MQEIDFVLEEIQQIDFGMEYATKVIEPLTQEKSVVPSTQKQEVEPDLGYTGLSKVIVEAVSNEIDENIQPNNIKLGVSILGVEGNVEPDKPDQTKEVNPSINEQIITADTGYELAEVKVNGVTSEIDENIKPENIKKGVEILGVVGTSEGATTVEKGVVINSYDDEGYPTDVSIVGMSEIPGYFMYYAMNVNTSGDYIYESVFARVRGNLHLPKNLTKIGTFAFASCATLALKNLPENVSSLGIRTFGNCTNLALESLPEGLTSIPERCFYACTNLPLTSLPSALKSIGTYAFSSCTNLALESLPEGLTSISTNAFYNCPAIKVKKIPSGVAQLTTQTFYGCTGLTEMTIEGNIALIGQKAFYNCTNLEKIILPNVTRVPTLSNKDAFTNTPIANGTGYIYIKDNLLSACKIATNWSTYASQIKGVSELA